MGNICLTAFLQGYGFLYWHRLDRVRVVFLRNVIGIVDEIRASRCEMALLEITKSLILGHHLLHYQGPTLPVHIQSYWGNTGAQPRARYSPLILIATSFFCSLKSLYPLMCALSQLKVSFLFI